MAQDKKRIATQFRRSDGISHKLSELGFKNLENQDLRNSACLAGNEPGSGLVFKRGNNIKQLG